MASKRWSELSLGGKLLVMVLTSLQVSLLVSALWDMAHRSPEELRGDKRMWAGIVFINWVGPLAYYTVGRKDGLKRMAGWCPLLSGD